MRKAKGRGGESVADHGGHGLRPEEIEADVFELWIGISRLMERVRGSDRRSSARTRVKPLPERHR
jgi:hypothetical protein